VRGQQPGCPPIEQHARITSAWLPLQVCNKQPATTPEQLQKVLFSDVEGAQQYTLQGLFSEWRSWPCLRSCWRVALRGNAV
jgi:hypothetical protein